MLLRRIADLVSVGASAALLLLILYAVGQPLFTDDLWWHLAWGHAHLAEGPWLDADPLLFTAPGAPAPSAWLADVLFALVERLAGFQGLRVLHASLVAGLLALAATTLRRVSGSWTFALIATAGFAALSAYRLVQLRPHLFSLLGVLVLYRLLFLSREPVGHARRIAAAVVTGVWANLHAGFLLSPMLVAAGGVAAFAEGLVGAPGEREAAQARGRALAWTFVLCSLATLATPLGIGAWLPFFVAGEETPSLGRVGDEWIGLQPFRWPGVGHPSPFVWLGTWLLFAVTLGLVVAWLRARRRGGASGVGAVDLALSALALGLAVSAVRFVWLGLLPLLALGRALSTLRPDARGRAPIAAALALAIPVAFLVAGDWPAISGFRKLPASTYREPYPAAKYHAHGVWLMRDAGIEGRVFNEYSLGGFLGYWLAPRVRSFVNGSLNVRADAIGANRALYQRTGARSEEGFLDTLDRLEIDLFLGLGPPVAPGPGQLPRYTAGHLEGAQGWTLVFRNMLTSLYVRDDAAPTAANLERLAAYYAEQGVPFDPARGFEPGVVVREAPDWARAHGVVPVDFPALEQRIGSSDRVSGALALDRIASVYSMLGEHEAALTVDRELALRMPDSPLVWRRLVWNALWLRDFEAAREFVARAPGPDRAPRDRLLEHAAEILGRADELEAERLASAIATMPLFAPVDLSRAMARFRFPAARPSPRRIGAEPEAAVRLEASP